MADNENIGINIDEQNDDVRFGLNDSIIEAVSPTAVVSKSDDTATITITDKNGTTSASISDGQDGISPTATVSKSGHTTTITITDKNGTTTADVYDGAGDAVNDVTVDGDSVVDENKVAIIPKADDDQFGTVKVKQYGDPPGGYAEISYDNDMVLQVPYVGEYNGAVTPLRAKYLPLADSYTNGAMSAADKTKLDALRNLKVYATRSTGPGISSTNIYVDNADFELTDGAIIAVRFEVGASENATLNINSTGALPIKVNNKALTSATVLRADEIGILVYDSRNYTSYTPHYELIAVSSSVQSFSTLNRGLVPKPPSKAETGDYYLLTDDGWVYYPILNGGLPDPNVQADWNETDSTSDAYIKNKPNVEGGIASISGTAPINVSGTSTDKSISISDATTSASGAMSSTDKTKLNGITAGAEPNRTYTAVTGKPTGNQTPSFGSTFTVSQISQNATGQISATDRTVKIPSTQASASTAGLMSSTLYKELDRIYTEGRMDFETDYSTVDYNLYQAIDALGWTSDVID